MTDEPFSTAYPAYQLAMKDANIREWCNSVYQEKDDEWTGGTEEWP